MLCTALMTISFYLLVVLQTSRVAIENGSFDKSKLMVDNGDLELVCLVAHLRV